MQLIRGYWPIYSLAALSIIGAIAHQFYGVQMRWIFADRWSLSYLLITPFLHGGVLHAMLNIMALHYIGGQMLLPILRARRFMLIFAAGALAGGVVNNLFSAAPAIGISAAVLALVACAIYPYGRLPMKLLLIHDLLRLRPFPLWTIVAFLVCLDVLGIIFDWNIFAHWAHLAGFAAGAIGGWLIFGKRPIRRRRVVH